MVGTGVDLVEVERVRRLVARRPEALARLFTGREQAVARGPHAAERLAGTFAAKEAALKALGTGLRRMAFREVEIVRDSYGRPSLRLSGRALERAQEIGARRFHVSISHLGSFAVASVIAEADGL
ncbi:MAG: holo-ACP synthase [Clostridia bacterium]|nr:holo-ACP synthase [Clostridia bacterium]